MSHHPIDHGITVTEVAPMDQPIALPQKTRAAFIGRALRGPLNTPVRIDSFAAFTRRFGGLWHRSAMSYAVQQFFQHGGSELYIVRVANNARGARLQLPCDEGSVTLSAVEPGSTESLRVAVDYDGIADDEHFNLVVQRLSPDNGLVIDQEIFSGLSCDVDDLEYIGDVLRDSELVTLELPLPAMRPRATMGRGTDSATPYVLPSERGQDGGDLCDYDLIGSSVSGTGLFALNDVDDFGVLYLPPAGLDREPGPTALLAAELYCRKRAAMLVIDPPAGWDDAARAAEGMRHAGFQSPNVLSYFPRLAGSSANSVSRAAGGAIVGLLCKLDEHDGPWGDLAARRYALYRGLRPVTGVSDEDARLLKRAGLNALVGGRDGGFVVSGGVTLGGAGQADRQFASLPVRRLCLAMGKAIENATRWAVFDNDRAHAAARVQMQVKNYLNALAAIGAFADDGYSVTCDVRHHRREPLAERGLTILLTFRPVSADAPLSLTLYQAPSGCRIASTAFAPVSDLQLQAG